MDESKKKTAPAKKEEQAKPLGEREKIKSDLESLCQSVKNWHDKTGAAAAHRIFNCLNDALKSL